MERLVDVGIIELDVLLDDVIEDVTDLEDEESEVELVKLLLVLDVLESIDVMLVLSSEDVLDVGIAEEEGDVVLGLMELDVRLVEVDDIEVEGNPPPAPPPTLELEDEDTEQTSAKTVFESKTIDAPIAKSPPLDVADVVSVIDSAARMVPWKVDPTPSVADDPTCQ
jgi:hypothetical protein